MKQVKRTYFGFCSADHSVITEWLEGYATQGWMLDSIGIFGLAKFIPTQRRDLKYAVGLASRMRPYADDEDIYDPLYLDAGWQPVLRHQQLAIYCSAPGGHPAPIQAERALGDPILWRQVAGTGIIVSNLGLLLLLLAMPVFLYLIGPAPLSRFFLHIDKMIPVFLLAISGFFGEALPTLRSLRYWRTRSRQLWQDEPAPVSSLPKTRRQIRVRLVFSILCYAVLMLIVVTNVYRDQPDYLSTEAAQSALVLTTEDLGLGEAAVSGLSESSYFLTYRTIGQICGDSISLDTYRYDCRYPFLAGLTIDGLYEALIGNVEPVSFFDECYLAADRSTILLRQGNIVIQLVGPRGFANLDTIALIRAGLSPKE